MKLSTEQVDSIRKDVDQGGIQIESLKEDVLDHFCCVVEVKMERGKLFEGAVREAILELAPNGLEELQYETVFFLNSTKIIFMKKVMYAIGLISAMAFVSGWAFGILHLPGTTELSIYGFLGFTFVFLPLLTIDYYKVNIRRALTEKLRFALGLLSGIMVALSVVFKMLQLPTLLPIFFFIAGSGLFVFGFLPFWFFSLYKKSVS